jgi:hypothetical protein
MSVLPLGAGATEEATAGADTRGRGEGGGGVVAALATTAAGPGAETRGCAVTGCVEVLRGPRASGALHEAHVCDCIGLNASH